MTISPIAKALLYWIAFIPLVASPLFLGFAGTWFFPDSFGKVIIFRLIVSAGLFLVLWQIIKSGRIDWPVKPTRLLFALGLWFLIISAATIFSADLSHSFWDVNYRSLGWFTYLYFFLFLGLLLYLFRNLEDWKKYFLFLSFVGLGVGIISVLQNFGIYFNPQYITVTVLERPSSTLGNPNTLADFILLVGFMTAALTFLSRGITRKVLIVALIFEFLALFLAGSRGGFLGLVFGAAVFFFIYPQSTTFYKKIAVAVVVVAVAGLLFLRSDAGKAVFSDSYYLTRLANVSLQEDTIKSRLLSWQAALKTFPERPILGFGPENYSVAFDKNYPPSFSSGHNLDEQWWTRAHNIFLEWLIGAGILGLAAFLFVFFEVFKNLLRLTRSDNKETAILATGATAAFAGHLAHTAFNFDTVASLMVVFPLLGFTVFLASRDANINDVRRRNIDGDEKSGVRPADAGTGNIIIKSAAGFLILAFLFLLWSYNLKPFLVNHRYNSEKIVFNQHPDESMEKIEKILETRTYLDHDLILDYYLKARTNLAILEEREETRFAGLERQKYFASRLEENKILQPTYIRNNLFLGEIYTSLARLEQDKTAEHLKRAIENYKDFIKVSPARPQSYSGIGKIYLMQREYDRAEEQFRTALSFNNEAAEPHFWLAVINFYNKDSAAGVAELNRAYRLGFPPGLPILASAFAESKDYPTFVQILEDQLAKKPRDIDTVTFLARAYKQVGRKDDARRTVQLLLEIDPELKPAADEFLQGL